LSENAQEDKHRMVEYALLAIAYPELVPFVSKILNVAENRLDAVVHLARKNLERTVVMLKLMGINITKDKIEEILSNESSKINLLSEFYKTHPETILKQKNLLFLLILNKKVTVKNISTEDLLSFLESYINNIDETYKLEIAREVANRLIADHKLELFPDKDLLHLLLLKKAIEIDRIPQEYLNVLLEEYPDIKKEYELKKAMEKISHDVKKLEELPESKRKDVMNNLPIDTLLKAPISLYKHVFQTLKDRFGEDMWLNILSKISKDTLPMITLLLTNNIEGDFVALLADEILKQHESILDETFKKIISAIAGNKVIMHSDDIQKIITIYDNDDALVQILKVIYSTSNLKLNIIYDMLPDRPELTAKLAIETGLIHELPKKLLFSVAALVPTAFFRSIAIPMDLKIEFAARFIEFNASKEFIKKTFKEHPTALEQYLYHILISAPEFIDNAINLGGNITRIALYALAYIATNQKWDRKRLINEFKRYKKTCPADLKNIIKYIKKGRSLDDVLKNTIGSLDDTLQQSYSADFIKLKSITKEETVKAFLRSSLRFISEQPQEQQEKLLNTMLNSVDEKYRLLIFKLIPRFNLHNTILKMVPLLSKDSSKDVQKAAIEAIREMFKGSGRENTALEMLKPLLNIKDVDVRLFTLKAIGEIFEGTGNIDLFRELKPLLNDSNLGVRFNAIETVGSIFRGTSNREILEMLRPLLSEPLEPVVDAVVGAIGKIFKGTGNMEIFEILRPFLKYKAEGRVWPASIAQRIVQNRVSEAIIELFKGSGRENEALNALKPLLNDSSESVQRNIAYAIGKMFKGTGSIDVLEALKPLLTAYNGNVRENAVEGIITTFKGSGRETDVLKALKPLLEYPPNSDLANFFRGAAANVISEVFKDSGCENVVLDELKLLLNSRDKYVRLFTTRIIGKVFEGTGNMDALEVLKPMLDDSYEGVREDAIIAIGRIFKGSGDIGVFGILKSALGDSSYSVRSAVAWAIGKVFEGTGNMDALEALKPMLGDSYKSVRDAAVESIVTVFKDSGCENDALKALEALLNDKNEEAIRNAAAMAIKKIKEHSDML